MLINGSPPRLQRFCVAMRAGRHLFAVRQPRLPRGIPVARHPCLPAGWSPPTAVVGEKYKFSIPTSKSKLRNSNSVGIICLRQNGDYHRPHLYVRHTSHLVIVAKLFSIYGSNYRFRHKMPTD